MSDSDRETIDKLGDTIWQRFVKETGASQDPSFTHLLDIRTLDGHGGSSCLVFSADKIKKGSLLSISMGPIGRYFNCHLQPKAEYDVPRFVFEGMLRPEGSQVTLDLFPDKDLATCYDWYLDACGSLEPVFKEARSNESIAWEHSRQMHMRVFLSPLALLAFDVPPDQLMAFESYAHRYFDRWIELLNEAEPIPSDLASVRHERRALMKSIQIANDPDRGAVAKIFGEEVTASVEDATML